MKQILSVKAAVPATHFRIILIYWSLANDINHAAVEICLRSRHRAAHAAGQLPNRGDGKE